MRSPFANHTIFDYPLHGSHYEQQQSKQEWEKLKEQEEREEHEKQQASRNSAFGPNGLQLVIPFPAREDDTGEK
jgi:hypothetical protein